MRNLNRVIAAGALAVPMAMGVSGVAVADVAGGSSVLPTQIAASEDDSSDRCDDEDGGLFGLEGLGVGGGSDNGGCEGDDGDDDNGRPI